MLAWGTQINWKDFCEECCNKLWKEIIFETSDAWSMRQSFHRPSNPAYHIQDCWISDVDSFLKHNLRFRMVWEIWAVLEFLKFLYLFISIPVFWIAFRDYLVKEGKNMFFEITALCWPKFACCSKTVLIAWIISWVLCNIYSAKLEYP